MFKMDPRHNFPRRDDCPEHVSFDECSFGLATAAVGWLGGLGEQGCKFINGLTIHASRVETKGLLQTEVSGNKRLLKVISVPKEVAIG